MMVVDSAILLFSVRHDKSKSSCKNISDMVDSCCVIVVIMPCVYGCVAQRSFIYERISVCFFLSLNPPLDLTKSKFI